MIPRLAHFFWFGEQVPVWVRMNVQAFKEMNPRWEVSLYHTWAFSRDLGPAVDRCHLWCQVADIAYCDVLRQQGGVVLDCDTVAIRSFDPLLIWASPWTTQHPPTVGGARRLTNGVMAGVAGGPTMTQACEEIARIARESKGRFRRTEFGPAMLTRLFSDGGMMLLPHHYFYPWGLLKGEREKAHAFWHAGEADRQQMLHGISKRFTDGEPPYAVHLWGVDGSSDAEIPPE